MMIRSEQREGKKTAMPRRAILALALAALAASAVGARAQMAPWPNDPPPAQPQAPWPGTAQPAPTQSPMQAPWPGSAPPAQPMMAPPGGMGAPGGAPMMQGPGPTPEQLACIRSFTQYREEVEKRGLAAKAANDSHKASREEMCKLVTAYSAAEVKWIKYTAENMTKCGIPKEIVEQIKKAHAHTDDARVKLCSAGPTGAPSAPSLSDALGTSRLPSQETEKRKAGTGTLDTLTGNALAR